MILQFLCPNGHKVHCSEERAGQAAKCPRCGVKFRIPTIEEVQTVGSSDIVGGSSVRVGSGSEIEAAASGIALGGATASDQIEFLCPNDHLLHGPARLQGRPGQCPECASRFRIPTYPDNPSDPQSVSPSVPQASNPILHSTSETSAAGNAQGGPFPILKHDSPISIPGVEESESTDGVLVHPTAKLVSRLWGYKSHGAAIELRCGDGCHLTPDQFVRSLSTASHGVFAVAEPNGTVTVMAVAWQAIQVVVAKGVRQFPEQSPAPGL
jgi:hypothetical protein